MDISMLTASQEERARNLLNKLDALSPDRRETALTMCNFFIDGMNAQKRLEQATTEAAG